MPNPTNPLQRFFRQPAIYIRLPSQGRLWPDGTLEVTANGEYPVYAMTAIDEITYQTPDALFNGEAVASVIQSCVPNVRDAWAAPAVDLDTIMIAIRIASYGHDMDIDVKCPKCSHEETLTADLRNLMDSMRTPDYAKPLIMGDLEIYFRSLNYRDITQNALAQFEQQKSLQIVNDSTASEQEKMQRLNDMMRQLVTVTVRTLTESINQIRTPDAVIDDAAFISEFLSNCDKAMFNQIRDHVVGLREQSEIKPLPIQCGNCQHQYQQSFTLDMSRFFG
jgi:hypothetical protein